MKILKSLVALGLLVWVTSSLAKAQITIPNTFTPGTTISSSSMNANFTAMAAALNRAGGTMTGTLISQQITPSSTATYDLGTTGVRFRDAWLSRNLTVGGALTVGSGVVALTTAAGKIQALSSTYLEDLSGASLTALPAGELTGTVATARLGSGSADSTNFLRGDQTWTVLGAFTNPAFVETNFSGNQTGDADWTLDAGDVTTLSYTVIGKVMTLQFQIVTSTTANSPTALRILIPGGYTVAKSAVAGSHWWAVAPAAGTSGPISVDTTFPTFVQLFKADITALWASGTDALTIAGTAVFQVN